MFVIGFWTTDKTIQPLAWSKTALSKKMLRSIVKKHFKNEDDYVEAISMSWDRLYSTKSEVKNELPKIGL